MPHGKQAKMLTPKQETAVLTYLQTRRYPARDQVMFLLSLKAGLRAKEIASLTSASSGYCAVGYHTLQPKVCGLKSIYAQSVYRGFSRSKT